MQLTHLADYARRLGCITEEQAPMAPYTSFKIGGPADLMVETADGRAAAAVLAKCREENFPVLFIGNGSNLLVSDTGVRGVVLHLLGRGQQPVFLDEAEGLVRVSCPAGISLQRFCLFLRDNGLSGLEFAYGIPATVGGAVYMNAGAYGGEVGQALLWAETLSPDGRFERLTAGELAPSYRHSALMENGHIVLSAVFGLRRGNKEEIGAQMADFMERRKTKQPLEFPSAGSFFKRPAGYYAGALIEQSGLKGFTVGGAQVSEKHAGFVINRGGATCADIWKLKSHVQQKVFEEHGVWLEPEVRFIGEEPYL